MSGHAPRILCARFPSRLSLKPAVLPSTRMPHLPTWMPCSGVPASWAMQKHRSTTARQASHQEEYLTLEGDATNSFFKGRYFCRGSSHGTGEGRLAEGERKAPDSRGLVWRKVQACPFHHKARGCQGTPPVQVTGKRDHEAQAATCKKAKE